MIQRIVLFLLLFGCWLVLSGFFTPFFMGVGAFCCALAVLLSGKMYGRADGHLGSVSVLFRLPRYVLWLTKEILVSSVDVAVKMWQIEPDIYPAMEWISSSLRDDLSLTVYGNSITLTPGTVAVMVREDGMIQVHALNKEGLDGLRGGEMEMMVRKLINETVVA